MAFYFSSSLTPTHFSKPLNPSNTLLPVQFPSSLSRFVRRRKPTEAKLTSKFNIFPSRRNALITCSISSSFEPPESSVPLEEDAESNRLFEVIFFCGKFIRNKQLESMLNLRHFFGYCVIHVVSLSFQSFGCYFSEIKRS